MPPPPPPSKSYHLVLDSSSSEEEDNDNESIVEDEEESYQAKYERIRAQVEAAKLAQQRQQQDDDDDDDDSKKRIQKHPSQATAATTSLQEDEEEEEDDDDESDHEPDDPNNSNTSPTNSNNNKNKKKKSKKRRRKKKRSTGSANNNNTNNDNDNNDMETATTKNDTGTASTTANNNNNKHVQFTHVSIQEYERCLGTDVVPGDGGWPLGIGAPIQPIQDDNNNNNNNNHSIHQVDIGTYEHDKQIRLRERARMLQALNTDTATSNNDNESDTNQEQHSVVLETRQWDYKRSSHKNPLFGMTHEEARMNLLLAASTPNHKEDDHENNDLDASSHQHHDNKRTTTKSSPDKHHHHHNTRSKHHHHNNNNDHHPHHHGRDRAGSFSQTLEHYNETYTQVVVHHVRNELEQLRFQRTGEGHVGCTCRKLKVYLPPPGQKVSKKAQHRRLAAKRVVDELKKRHLLPTRACTRDELEHLLHDAVEQEACCSATAHSDCPCRKHGIECQADVCSCWHESHLTAEEQKQADDHRTGVDVSSIQERCGNPHGMYAVNVDAIHQRRVQLLEQLHNGNDAFWTQCHPVTTTTSASSSSMEVE